MASNFSLPFWGGWPRSGARVGNAGPKRRPDTFHPQIKVIAYRLVVEPKRSIAFPRKPGVSHLIVFDVVLIRSLIDLNNEPTPVPSGILAFCGPNHLKIDHCFHLTLVAKTRFVERHFHGGFEVLVNKSIIGVVLTVLLLSGGVAGCATTARWDDTSVIAVREGMTKSEVSTLLGQPESTSMDQDGKVTWTYRRPSDNKTFIDRYVTVASLGMTQGLTSDVLTIHFGSNDRVSSFRFSENVDALQQRGL